MGDPVDARSRETARELLDRRDFAAALSAAKEAIALAPAEPYNHWLAGWIRMSTPGRTADDVEAAIASYRLALTARHKTGSWVADLGDALVAAGHDDEAITSVTAETRDPDHDVAAAAHTWLGWYFSRKRVDNERALGHLLEGTRLRTRWGLALLNLAYVEDRLGMRARAFAHYSEAAECGSYDDAFATRRADELRGEIERGLGERPADGAALSVTAVARMATVAEQLRSCPPASWFGEIAPELLGDRADEFILAGLIAPLEGSATSFRLTAAGRAFILDRLGLVVSFCPKCSTPVHLATGSIDARATCPTCGVRWTEDTTAAPFVSKY
jgi:Tfp pilus assembly protein PilF